MATVKHLLVLANSIKHAPCTCVAGREIIPTASQYEIGPWIRPINTHGEGELSPTETRLADGRQPTVMDFVEVPVSQHANDRLQPENWTIAHHPGWKRINANYQKPSIDLLLEKPSDLWLEPGSRTDRIKNARLRLKPPTQSLYLIKVDRLRIRFEWKQWEGTSSKRRRAIFEYRGIKYDLALTDPVFNDSYRMQFPSPGGVPRVFDLPGGNAWYLCVSLTPAFRGDHYKVVATVVHQDMFAI